MANNDDCEFLPPGSTSARGAHVQIDVLEHHVVGGRKARADRDPGLVQALEHLLFDPACFALRPQASVHSSGLRRGDRRGAPAAAALPGLAEAAGSVGAGQQMAHQKLRVPACPRWASGHAWRLARERSTKECGAR